GNLGLAEILGPVQPFAVNVAYGDHLRRLGIFADLHHPPHVAGTAPAEADAADVDAIVRAQNPRVDVGMIDRRSARGDYTGLDEVSACGLVSHTSLLSLILKLNACCGFQFDDCAPSRDDVVILQSSAAQINGLTRRVGIIVQELSVT